MGLDQPLNCMSLINCLHFLNHWTFFKSLNILFSNTRPPLYTQFDYKIPNHDWSVGGRGGIPLPSLFQPLFILYKLCILFDFRDNEKHLVMVMMFTGKLLIHFTYMMRQHFRKQNIFDTLFFTLLHQVL